MNAVDGSEHYESASQEQNPSLLTIILDTNPGPWAVLADKISLSTAVANILVFINAHLACNYTNKVAIIASHSTTAQWLYPSPTDQRQRRHQSDKRPAEREVTAPHDPLSEPTKRLKLHGPKQDAALNGELPHSNGPPVARGAPENNKYRPFRMIEEELIRNLSTLLSSTDPSSVSAEASTMIAGAFTLALSYINRETIAYTESISGPSKTNFSDQPTANNSDPSTTSSQSLDSRILLLSVSPSPDLAHQYIPIMNAIFACQRLSIPIDVLQIPLPLSPSPSETNLSDPLAASPFLQQASDATHGIYISTPPTGPNDSPPSLITYLLMALLPSPSVRRHLVLPTSISVDFRAACFCHRNIIDIGFVCSICLSIFCSVPENGDCLTCGTHLAVGEYGGRPIVVNRKQQRRNRTSTEGGGGGNRVSTPATG